MVYSVSYKGNADVKSGRIASFTLPSSHSISYSYDSFDRLIQKSMFINSAAIPTEKFGYYTANNKTVNLVTSHTINVNNYMNNPQSQVIYNYTYDDYGNILTVKEGSTLKLSYVYDELNQLTRENNAYANKTYVYTYDKNGNILTKKTYAYTTGTLGTVQSTINYTYGNSSWKDLLTNYNGTSISYDGVGNPTNWRGGLSDFVWTGRQLSQFTQGDLTYDFTYNSDGIRTKKAVTDPIAPNIFYTHFILDGTKVVAQYETDYYSSTPYNTIYFYYDESGSPTGMKYNGNVYYFQKNLQGDIIRILNTNGSIVATYTYDAWGNIISSTDTSGVSIGTKNPFRYRGYYYDTETGLYYLNSRYYDPQVGRFINIDNRFDCSTEILFCNLFVYCANNCIIKYDPLGQDAIWLQDTDNVYSAGHTGLLLEDDDGAWYHFYWGNNRSGKKGKSGSGKTIIKYSGKINLESINDLYFQEYGNTYEKMIYFEGDFSASISYINELVNKNKRYNLILRNCMQMSARALSKGTFRYSSSYYKTFLRIIENSTVPNIAYNRLLNFHKAVQKWHLLPWWIKWTSPNPLEAVIIF